ncbi:hypothetical protein Hdeb2414_s0002g00067161 [Helianthus debilis subsp. tardiflorus]
MEQHRSAQSSRVKAGQHRESRFEYGSASSGSTLGFGSYWSRLEYHCFRSGQFRVHRFGSAGKWPSQGSRSTSQRVWCLGSGSVKPGQKQQPRVLLRFGSGRKFGSARVKISRHQSTWSKGGQRSHDPGNSGIRNIVECTLASRVLGATSRSHN